MLSFYLLTICVPTFPLFKKKRKLQFLADQEKISPAAIKKTTLDKVLQQSGVNAENVGIRPRTLSVFNSKTKKN